MKYIRNTTLSSKDIVTGKSELVEKTAFPFFLFSRHICKFQFNHGRKFLTKRDCKHNLKKPSCKDGNARFTTVYIYTLKSFVWSSVNQNNIYKFENLKNNNIFHHSIVEIKITRVSLGTKHCHQLCVGRFYNFTLNL